MKHFWKISHPKVDQIRTLKAKRNILQMLLYRGINVFVSLLYVPLLIKSLNSYNYGIWLTMTSVIAWFNLFDIGLGNGLRNKLAESLANNDILKSKHLISTAYGSITMLCILLAVIFILINPYINYSQIFNAPTSMNHELSILMSVVFLLFCFQFTLSIMNSILMAFQLPALSSLITMLGQLLSFFLVFLAVTLDFTHSLLYLGTIISISPIIILLIFTLILFKGKLKAFTPRVIFFKLYYLKDIIGLGLKFFILQLITIVFYQTSNIIIAHKVGPQGVTEYNIAYKYIGVISMIFTIIVTPFWSATTDAYIKNDYEWIKSIANKLRNIWLMLSVCGLILLLCSKFVYSIWLGQKLEANYIILGLTLIYFIFQMLYGTYGYILNGIGKIRLQLIVTSILAIIYLPLALYLSEEYGLKGTLLAMIFIVLINSIWSNIQLKKILNRSASGIWNK